MAHFTMEFFEAVEITGGRIEFNGENGNDTGHTRIVGGAINLSKYPIFDEAYRPRLNGLIIDRFYNQEIAHETVNKFKLQLRAHLNETMPYFNRLYTAYTREIDPLSTIDLHTLTVNTANQTTSGTASNSTETQSKTGSRSVFSDLPQTMLAGNEDYASNATDANSGASVTAEAGESSSSETDSTSDGDTHVLGYQGHAGELLAAYRDTLTNIDTLVLDSMQPLFMGIWHSSENATLNQGYYYGF